MTISLALSATVRSATRADGCSVAHAVVVVLANMLAAALSFASDDVSQRTSRDSRASIAARHASRGSHETVARDAVDALVPARFLLADAR
jgi:hypothetical protein